MGAIALAAQTVPAETVRTTAMVGIATGQTARLNLLNPGILPPAPGVVCTAAVTYLDGAGNVRKSVTVTVDPGKSVPVDLHSDADLSLAPASRLEIRATIVTTSASTAVPACKLIPTLEIFDSITGRTQAVVGKVETVN
jgi:hypothetical protein